MAEQGRLKRLWNWLRINPWKSVFDVSIGVIGTLIAIWGVAKFFYYERAAYEPRANVSSTLEWRPSSLADRCEAMFKVQLENSGVATFDISQTQVRVWGFDSEVLDGQEAAYLSLEKMQEGKLLFDSNKPSFSPTFEATETPFVQHYAVGATFNRSFQWLIARKVSSNVYFRADFTLKDNKTRWFTAAWGPTCGDTQTAKPNSSPSPSPSPPPSPAK